MQQILGKFYSSMKHNSAFDMSRNHVLWAILKVEQLSYTSTRCNQFMNYLQVPAIIVLTVGVNIILFNIGRHLQQ